MEILEKTGENPLVVTLNGKLDAVNAGILDQWTMDRIESLSGGLVIDFGGLSYVCSSGLRVVLSIAKEMKRLGRRFAICGLYGSVREVFMVSGFMQILPIFNSLEEAMADE